jgi:microcystin-dependent protein
MMMWSTGTAPTGWLLCDGSDVSRTTYADLFAVIGTTYGSIDSLTFKVPDMRANFPLGANGSYALASTGGTKNVTLTTTELPAHSHTVTDPGHIHDYTFLQGTASPTGSGGVTCRDILTTAQTASATTGITVNSAGSGAAFSVLNSYLAINFIIKF